MTLRKALALLREDGLIKDVPGVGHFVRTQKSSNSHGHKTPTPSGSNVTDEPAVRSSCLPDRNMAHPVYSYCQEELDSVESQESLEKAGTYKGIANFIAQVVSN